MGYNFFTGYGCDDRVFEGKLLLIFRIFRVFGFSWFFKVRVFGFSDFPGFQGFSGFYGFQVLEVHAQRRLGSSFSFRFPQRR